MIAQFLLLLVDINLPDYDVLSDSAFPVSGELFKRIVTFLKENDLERSAPAARPALAALSNAITSMRQAAEWGMGAVEKVYRRLLEPLPFDQKRRGRRILSTFLPRTAHSVMKTATVPRSVGKRLLRCNRHDRSCSTKSKILKMQWIYH